MAWTIKKVAKKPVKTAIKKQVKTAKKTAVKIPASPKLQRGEQKSKALKPVKKLLSQKLNTRKNLLKKK
jgi:hypothetical protein